ncbi:MAG: TrmH family RNA methyltransferase [Anaeromyxobacteraceae bacterium]
MLHRPSSAENVGQAARAMKNFGLSRLAIVAPPSWAGAPRSGADRSAGDDVMDRARTTARHASDLLEGAEVHPDLAAALGPATWTCGTTSRTLPGRPRLHPRELAAEVARRSLAGEVAVVFGEERRGLSDAELELCQAVCTIPTSSAYDSMNLAQAVAVVAYEIAGAPVALPAEPAPEPARHATVEALWARLQAMLGAAGFTNPQNPEQVLADFRRLLARAGPSQREVELLLAGAKALERLLKRPA